MGKFGFRPTKLRLAGTGTGTVLLVSLQFAVISMSGGVPRDRHGGSFDRRKRRHAGASSSHGVEDDVGIEHTQLVQLVEEQDRQMRALRRPIQFSAAMWACSTCRIRRRRRSWPSISEMQPHKIIIK